MAEDLAKITGIGPRTRIERTELQSLAIGWWNHLAPVFWTVIVMTHFWGYLVLLYRIPGYLLMLNMNELLGVIMYVQIGLLVECISITLALFGISYLLPKKMLRSNFSLQGSLLVFFTAIASGIYQFWGPIAEGTSRMMARLVGRLGFDQGQTYLSWITSYPYWISAIAIITIIWFLGLVLLLPRFSARSEWHDKFNQIIRRVSVLAMIFLVLDLNALILTIIRLIF